MKTLSLLLLLAGLVRGQTTTKPAAIQHGINVTWTNPTGTLTKNTVYSGATSAGPFTPIFTSTTPITNYLDPMTTTNQGVQSCYVVTAWTTIESNQSTAVCQTFPVQPGVPYDLDKELIGILHSAEIGFIIGFVIAGIIIIRETWG